MFFLKSNIKRTAPSLEKNFFLTKSCSTADLPQSYLTVLQERNGGYVCLPRVETVEPTSDGLSHANLHYIFGIHDDADYSILFQQERAQLHHLPDYLVVFSANEQQLFAFDYSQLSSEKEPAIRYLEMETDNWQTVAPDFKTFMNSLEPGEIIIPLEGKLTRFEAEHAFLLTTEAVMLNELWMHLEDVEDKVWYFRWMAYFALHPQVGFRQATIDALENQILYFRLFLPENTLDVLSLFLADKEDSIRHQAEWLLEEWEDGRR